MFGNDNRASFAGYYGSSEGHHPFRSFEQLGVQFCGATIILAWTLATGFLVLALIYFIVGIRIPDEGVKRQEVKPVLSPVPAPVPLPKEEPKPEPEPVLQLEKRDIGTLPVGERREIELTAFAEKGLQGITKNCILTAKLQGNHRKLVFSALAKAPVKGGGKPTLEVEVAMMGNADPLDVSIYGNNTYTVNGLNGKSILEGNVAILPSSNLQPAEAYVLKEL